MSSNVRDANPALGVIRCSGGGFVHIKRVQVQPKSKSQGRNTHGKNRSDDDHDHDDDDDDDDDDDHDHDNKRKTKDIQPQSQQVAAPLYTMVISSRACKSQEAGGAWWVKVESGQSFIQYRQAPNQAMTLVAVRFDSTKNKKFTRKLISVTDNKLLRTREFDYTVRGQSTASIDDVRFPGGQFHYLIDGTHADESVLYTATGAPNPVAGWSSTVLRADVIRVNVSYVSGTNTSGFGTDVDRRYVSGELKRELLDRNLSLQR